MTEREFCYWLQGHLELSDTDELDANQVWMIKEHLDLVFTKVTPATPGTPFTPGTTDGNGMGPIMC